MQKVFLGFFTTLFYFPPFLWNPWVVGALRFHEETVQERNSLYSQTGAPEGVRNGGRPRRKCVRHPECSAPKGAEGAGRKH
jgi:hypothetical protein